MRKKRIILWGGVLAVVVLAAGLYPVVSKQMKTPRVTWYLEAPVGMDISVVSPSGRYFVADGGGRLCIAKEGDSKWTELPTPYQGGDVWVSDLGTVMFQKDPVEWTQGTQTVADWYWFRAGEKGVHMDPKLSPYPLEFLEGSDDWIGVYGRSQDKLGVFDLSGALLQPLEPPIKKLVGLDKYWIGSLVSSSPIERYRMQWEFNAPDSSWRRYFVRVGTKFEERKMPPVPVHGFVNSYDGHWFAVYDSPQEIHFYKDGVLKEKLSLTKPPGSTGLDELRDLFDQYVWRRPKAQVFSPDSIHGFDLNGKRRVGTVVSENIMSEGYVQVGGDRFYAPELGLPPKGDKEEFRMFLYISPDGRRIIGLHSLRDVAFVFAIDR